MLDCEPNAGDWIVRLLVPLASGRADGAMLKCKNTYLESEAVIGNLRCTISPIYWGTNHTGALNSMGFVQVTVL